MRKRKRRPFWRWLRWLFVLVVLAAAGAGAAAWYAWQRAHEPFQGFTSAEQFVDVPQGSGAIAIGQRLAEAGVVRDVWTFRVALFATGRARDLKAGEYRFTGPMSAVDVVDKVARGDVHKRLLTFPEGLTIADMARLFEERGFGTAAEFRKAASDPALVSALDPQARDLEGYLFPETYALPRNTPAREVVRQMVAGFTRAFDPALVDAAGAAGLTVRQVVTLASLVEKETARADERPMVAAVYRNRLRIGMGMQADPTVIYALQKAGKYTGNLTREDLQFDSPYNTYRYAGLPPGPIAAPSAASLRAVLKPAEVSYLYFVSRNDGSHVFATTLAEHNRNVEEWQKRYFRRPR